MPVFALANLMWGGWEHPLYQNLTDAMRLLLGRGRPFLRKIVLGKGSPDEQSSALEGRMDGGMEVDGITTRPRIEVTPAEPQGHVLREQAISEAEQRSERNAYKCVPLTGCHQSMLPGYRSNAAFGRIADFELDDHGLCKATELAHTWRNPQLSDVDADWNLDDNGEVLGVLNADREPARLNR